MGDVCVFFLLTLHLNCCHWWQSSRKYLYFISSQIHVYFSCFRACRTQHFPIFIKSQMRLKNFCEPAIQTECCWFSPQHIWHWRPFFLSKMWACLLHMYAMNLCKISKAKLVSCPLQFCLQHWTCWISVNLATGGTAKTGRVPCRPGATARKTTITGRRRMRRSWSRWKLNRQDQAWEPQRGHH